MHHVTPNVNLLSPKSFDIPVEAPTNPEMLLGWMSAYTKTDCKPQQPAICTSSPVTRALPSRTHNTVYSKSAVVASAGSNQTERCVSKSMQNLKSRTVLN